MSSADNIIRKSSPMAEQTFYRLVIDCSGEKSGDAYSLNQMLAEELLKLRPRQRSMQMEKTFLNVLERLPENPVVKDVDVLFNPAYKVDVLLTLVSTYKKKPFRLIWPGIYRDGKLVYSDESYPDYKTYEISDYDIICIY